MSRTTYKEALEAIADGEGDPQVIARQTLEHGYSPGSPAMASYAAEELTPGTEVEVDCEYYTGPGAVTDQTKNGAHILHLGEDHAGDDRGFYVAVMIPNGNIHLYPIDTVKVAKREAA